MNSIMEAFVRSALQVLLLMPVSHRFGVSSRIDCFGGAPKVAVSITPTHYTIPRLSPTSSPSTSIHSYPLLTPPNVTDAKTDPPSDLNTDMKPAFGRVATSLMTTHRDSFNSQTIAPTSVILYQQATSHLAILENCGNLGLKHRDKLFVCELGKCSERRRTMLVPSHTSRILELDRKLRDGIPKSWISNGMFAFILFCVGVVTWASVYSNLGSLYTSFLTTEMWPLNHSILLDMYQGNRSKSKFVYTQFGIGEDCVNGWQECFIDWQRQEVSLLMVLLLMVFVVAPFAQVPSMQRLFNGLEMWCLNNLFRLLWLSLLLLIVHCLERSTSNMSQQKQEHK